MGRAREVDMARGCSSYSLRDRVVWSLAKLRCERVAPVQPKPRHVDTFDE